MTIEASGSNDEIGHVEREEPLAIETAWIALRQHKGLAHDTFRINMTEVRTRKETVITTGTNHEPA